MKNMLDDLCCIDCVGAFDSVSAEMIDISVGELYSDVDTASNPVGSMSEERAHISYGRSWTSINAREYESDPKMKNIILIQALIRGSIARRKAEVEKIRQGAREKMDRLKRHHAALRIQLFVRSIIAKNTYRDKLHECSAIILQSRARGMIARENVRDLRNLIENHARKLVARQEEARDQQLFVAKSKTMNVDCNTNMPHSLSKNNAEDLNREMSEVKVLEKNTILIQTWARMVIAKKRSFQELRNASAVVLQSQVRGMLVRNRMQKRKRIRNISRTAKVDGTVLLHQIVDSTTIGKNNMTAKRQDQNNNVRVALPNPGTSTRKQNPLFQNSENLQKGGISTTSGSNTFKTSPTLGVSATECNTVHKNKKFNERIRRENAAILIQNYFRCLCARRNIAKLRAQVIEAEIETENLSLASSSIALFEYTPTVSQLTHDDGSDMFDCENSIVASTATHPKRKIKKGLKTWRKQAEETKKIAPIEGIVLPHPLSLLHTMQNDQASAKTDGEGHTTTTVASTVSYLNELVSNLSLSSCIGFGTSSSSLEVRGLSASKSVNNKSVKNNVNALGTVICNEFESLDQRDDKDYKLEPKNHRQRSEINIRHGDGSIECNELKRESRKSKMMAAIKFDKKAENPVDHNSTGKKPKMPMTKFFSRNRSFGRVQEISTKTRGEKSGLNIKYKKNPDNAFKDAHIEGTSQKKTYNANTSKAPLSMKIKPDTKKNAYTAIQDVPGKITNKKKYSGTNLPRRDIPASKKKNSDMRTHSSKDFPCKVTSKRRDVGTNKSKKDTPAAKKMVLDTYKKPEKVSKDGNNKVVDKKRDSGAFTSKKKTSATRKMDPDMKKNKKKISSVTFIPVSLSSFHNQSDPSKLAKEDTLHRISTLEADTGSAKKEAPSTKQNKKKNLRKWFSRELDKAQDGKVDGCYVKDLEKNRERVYGCTVNVAHFQ